MYLNLMGDCIGIGDEYFLLCVTCFLELLDYESRLRYCLAGLDGNCIVVIMVSLWKVDYWTDTEIRGMILVLFSYNSFIIHNYIIVRKYGYRTRWC